MTLLRGALLGALSISLCGAFAPHALAAEPAHAAPPSAVPPTIATSPAAPRPSLLLGDYSTHRLAIVAPDGSLEWETAVSDIHDAANLADGNILFQQGWTKVVEMTRQHRVVWKYDAAADAPPGKVEVHAFQRLPDGLTMIAESGPARIIEIDRHGKIVATVKLKVDHPSPHRDTRLVRKLATGNYLVAHEGDAAVREYDATGRVVWEYPVGNKVYSAVRLKNGNTLIGCGDGHRVIEVTPAGKIVWQVEEHDLPGITLAWVTMVERLADGSTLIGNCHAGPANPQVIAVSPEKKVLWTFKDFKNFGNALPVARVMDDPFHESSAAAGTAAPIPNRLVVLTFDDGNKSDIEIVAPLLNKYGYRATFFITEGLGADKDKKNFMTWDEVQRLGEQGFEIGNHTAHHVLATQQTADQFRADVAAIDRPCQEHFIPHPTSFCYPSYAHDLKSVGVLRELGYQFARRGMYPELKYVEGGGRGFVYDPKQDDPLLIPFTAVAGPKMQFEDLAWAVDQAHDGKICVLALHGVPARLHPWVSTPPEELDRYLRYLKEKGCTVIALKDLARYVDPAAHQADPYTGVNRRIATMKEK